MKKIKSLIIGLIHLMVLSITLVTNTAQASATEDRKAEFRQMVINQNPSGSSAMAILAKEGIAIPDAQINEAINYIQQESVGDFRLSQLVRVLYLSGDQYEDQVLQHLSGVRYWLTSGEQQYVYWSENHMLMWTASAYLMKQRYGWQMDEHLETRLNHYLDLKIKHGFYEFFSATYHAFTLGALLNLVDFAEDPEIKNKAEIAAKRMMTEMLLVYNDQGAFYSASGRDYNNQFTSFSASSMFWMLTGKGPKRTSADYAGGFLATSTINLDDVAASYQSTVNTTLTRGHSQADRKTVHAGLTREERTIFQWSSGGYFHPDTANDTNYTVDYFDLQDRSEFKDLAIASFLPDNWFNGLAKIGATYSRGSNLSKSTHDIYKNKNVVLTSLDNYYPGYKGYQQWPWAATLEDIGIWTQTGDIPAGWAKDGGVSQNTHLPKVQQSENVALITYLPNTEIRQGNDSKRVTLHWPTERFDEYGEISGHNNGNWLVARKNDSYIAVLRSGSGKNADGFPTEWGDKGRQMWAVVVGNKDTHGSYNNFKNVIDQGKIKETYKFDWRKFRKVYFTRIDVDGKYIRNWW